MAAHYHPPPESLDLQLRAAYERRENAVDLCVRALIEIDTLTERIDVLLDRKITETRCAPWT